MMMSHHAPEPDPSFEALRTPTDPWADPLWDEHPGVELVRTAARCIDAGDPVGALDQIDAARTGPMPVELVPHAAVLEGIAAIATGDLGRARAVLERAWSAHPDFAALPTALGATQIAGEDEMSAAHSLYAALISDDPDRSLAIHRRRLTPLLGVLRRAGR